MLFLGQPVYEIAKLGRKIGFSALELGYNDLAQKLCSQGSIGSFFKHSVQISVWNYLPSISAVFETKYNLSLSSSAIPVYTTTTNLQTIQLLRSHIE